mmetsp:Transcript_5498/g.12187  ORF Transcript_5498/g.12187 Transcript_5498/m.12187 type:complete len:80 (+) Transcript_5498:3835-4074(+)
MLVVCVCVGCVCTCGGDKALRAGGQCGYWLTCAAMSTALHDAVTDAAAVRGQPIQGVLCGPVLQFVGQHVQHHCASDGG